MGPALPSSREGKTSAHPNVIEVIVYGVSQLRLTWEPRGRLCGSAPKMETARQETNAQNGEN